MEVARIDSDTISNVFLSTVNGSVSTFLLESRELTLDDVNCLRTSTNGSERLRSNDSAALGTALIALDTDGTGEEEWLVGTPPEAKGERKNANQAAQPMASIPEAIYCSAPQIRNTHEGPSKAAQRKRSMSTPEQATVYAVSAGAGLPDMPALAVPGPQRQGEEPGASCIPGPVSPPRTPPGSGSRIPRPGSGASASRSGAGVGSSPGSAARMPSKLRPPSSRKPQLKDLEDGWRSCIDTAENPEASTGAEVTDAADVDSECATYKPSAQEAQTQGQQVVDGREDVKSVAEKDGHDSAAHGHARQSNQDQAAKTGCACCTLM
ncbi:g2017 [Coccomyxa viridis]|uniref:G2017 protein n=1 Tax=Coccomyxa viridis TaxID=1274662 RepID=A0ABP1FJE0_9CHLO